jgi:hypothetical protein
MRAVCAAAPPAGDRTKVVQLVVLDQAVDPGPVRERDVIGTCAAFDHGAVTQ